MTQLSPLRAGRITGSRVPAVLGLSPFQDADGVLREMVRQYFGAPAEFTGNIATDYGHEHEPDAIEAYEQQEGVLVHAAQQFLIHHEHDWLGVSPDGLLSMVGEQGMLEVKCPFRNTRYTAWWQRRDIAAQMRLQMECADAAWCDLGVWRPNQQFAVSRMDRDPAWLPLVLDTLKAFIERYETTIATEKLYAPLLEPLVNERTDDEWLIAAMEWHELHAELLSVAEEEAAAKQRLADLAGGRKTRGGGVLVYFSEPKGRVNYKRLCADRGITEADLDVYRGNPQARRATVKATIEKES